MLRSRPENGRRTSWRCADESQLAAYFDGTLDAAARRSLESHLADCKSCLEQISFLVHSSEWPEPTDVPAWLVANARKLVPDKTRAQIFFGWHWATASLAAVLVLTVLAVLVIRFRNSEPPVARQDQPSTQQPAPDSRTVAPPSNPPRNPDAVAIATTPSPPGKTAAKPGPSAPLIRNTEAENRSLKLLTPADGAIIKSGQPIEIRWQKVPEAVFYEVSIITASGEIVTSRQTEGVSQSIPIGNQLIPGSKYFVSVRAHLRDGKTVRSGLVSFRAAE